MVILFVVGRIETLSVSVSRKLHCHGTSSWLADGVGASFTKHTPKGKCDFTKKPRSWYHTDGLVVTSPLPPGRACVTGEAVSVAKRHSIRYSVGECQCGYDRDLELPI